MIITDLMTAVKTAVDAGTYTVPFASTSIKLVPVTPASNRPMEMIIGYEGGEENRIARCQWEQLRTVRCIISNYVGIGDLEAQTLDCMTTVREVVDQVKSQAATVSSGGEGFVLVGVRVDPEYNYEALLEEALFLSVIYLDYKGYL
mgnify:CR=1 FL=1